MDLGVRPGVAARARTGGRAGGGGELARVRPAKLVRPVLVALLGLPRDAPLEQHREHLDEVGIELDAGLAPQLVDRLLVGDRLPVRAAGDHRLVRVHDGHDPGPDRDVCARQAQGVAAPVEPLVVVEHDRRGVAQGARLLEDDLPDLGVLGHDAPLRRHEVAGLGQDLVRDGELAQVVEEARGPDPVQLAIGQVDRARERDRGLRDQRGRPAGPRRALGEGGDQRLLRGTHRGPSDVQRLVARGGRDRRPADRVLVARLAEHEHLVAAQRLRGVQGGVGVAHQRVEPQNLAHAARDTRRHRDRQLLAALDRDLGAADDPAQLLGQGRRRVHVRLGQQDQELLPAVPSRDVDRADVGGQQLGDGPQDGVPGRVAVRVVEPLEVVEVHQDHGQRAVVADRAGQLLLHAGQDGLPVRDPGQRVDRRQAPRVGHAIGQAAKRGPQPGVVDPRGVQRDELALVGGVGQPVGQRRDAAVLAAHDECREPGGAGERPDERGQQQHGGSGGQDVQGTSRDFAVMRPPMQVAPHLEG